MGQQILVKRLEPSRVILLVEREMGLPIPIEHHWQTISHDISSQDVKETILKEVKDI